MLICAVDLPPQFLPRLFCVKLKKDTNFLLVCSLETTSIYFRAVDLKKKCFKNIQVLAVKVYALPVTSKAG